MSLIEFAIGVVFTLHLIWIGVLVTGTVAAMTGWLSRRPAVQLVFNVVVVLTLLSHAILQGCALTIWQWGLVAARSGGESPSAGFLEYYIGLDDGATAWIVEGLIVIGLVSQLFWWTRHVKLHR